jgi:uncharacterized membrane protein
MAREWDAGDRSCHPRHAKSPQPAKREDLMTTTRLAATVAAAMLTGLAVSADAAPTDSAPLDCGAEQVFDVTGFGRGQVLHLVGSTE